METMIGQAYTCLFVAAVVILTVAVTLALAGVTLILKTWPKIREVAYEREPERFADTEEFYQNYQEIIAGLRARPELLPKAVLATFLVAMLFSLFWALLFKVCYWLVQINFYAEGW